MPISKICNNEDWNHNQVFLYVYDHRSIIATFKNTCCSKNSCWILIFLRVLRHDPSLVLSHYRGVALKWAWPWTKCATSPLSSADFETLTSQCSTTDYWNIFATCFVERKLKHRKQVCSWCCKWAAKQLKLISLRIALN